MTETPLPPPTEHERELAAVRREFTAGLTARVALLRDALEHLSRDPTPETLEAFHLPAHALKGTAASFGAADLEVPAAELSTLAGRWRAGGVPPDELRTAADALERLAAAVERYRRRAAAP